MINIERGRRSAHTVKWIQRETVGENYSFVIEFKQNEYVIQFRDCD